MRFKKIEKINIDDLHLDQGNYRFKKAANQKDCVKKIHFTNPQYFRGLMKSIAEDDLGEPLLVYRNNGENIVSDGNRRLSALKVLHDDDYAPTESIKDYAKELRAQNKIVFSKIHAQVSEDKKLVSRTVYERHSGGKDGTSRIPWNAYAAARFGFVEQIGNHKEWRIMSLLSRTEKEYPSMTPFLDSPDFSYEVFRRLIKAGLDNGIISENIFSERGERIKKTARTNLVKDATTKARKFLSAMKKKDISLSRKDGSYADKDTIDQYLKNFRLSPDNQKLEDAKKGSNNEASGDSTETSGENESKGNSSSEDNDNGNTDEGDNKPGGLGINKSDTIKKKLTKLDSTKLSGLYNSLCTVSLNAHPQLMYAGAWSFLECLCRHMGKNDNTNFLAFLNGKMNEWTIEKGNKSDYKTSLNDIMNKGNANKHSAAYASINALQLRQDFKVLNPLISKALGVLIDKNNTA